jgi:exoribonuclease II
MNLASEIEFYAELRLIDKARLLNLFLHELAEEARTTYGAGVDQVHDGAHLRFVNELYHRLTRVVEQLLAEDATRPADEVVLRMLLAPRADKMAERLVFNAYARAIQGFERYDTTVLMGGG